MVKWQCQECKFVGQGDDTIEGHSMAHIYAEQLLIEILNEKSTLKFPIQYERV